MKDKTKAETETAEKVDVSKTVGELGHAPYNPRRISKADLENLERSMREFGDLSGIIFNVETGNLVGGHQRTKVFNPLWPVYKTMLKAPDAVGTVAVGTIKTPYGDWSYREVRWPEQKEKAANISANKARADWDLPMLKDILVGLDDGQFDIGLTGFDLDEMASLLGLEADAVAGEDEVPELDGNSKRVNPGELWALGESRLYCGDATSEGAWAALMAGADPAAMVFTDPPYGVSYESKSGKFDVIKGDEKRGDDLLAMLVPAFKNAVKWTAANAAFYIWHASSTREDFAFALKAAGIVEKQYIIWAKPSLTLGHADYHWAHEPCFYAGKDGAKPNFFGDRAQPTVWRASLSLKGNVAVVIGQGLLIRDGRGNTLYLTAQAPKTKKVRAVRLADGAMCHVQGGGTEGAVADLWEIGKDTDYVHPTQKPVELYRRGIKNSSSVGDIVLDPFSGSGSGSGFIAAHTCGRRLYGLELDPKYASVIISRWEKFTGFKAQKL